MLVMDGYVSQKCNLAGLAFDGRLTLTLTLYFHIRLTLTLTLYFDIRLTLTLSVSIIRLRLTELYKSGFSSGISPAAQVTILLEFTRGYQQKTKYRKAVVGEEHKRLVQRASWNECGCSPPKDEGRVPRDRMARICSSDKKGVTTYIRWGRSR